MYSTKILLDSVSPAGRRLTTWELTYPRMVHAELMTHRLFSRNSASSRAIPNERLRKAIAEDPALPVWWGKNQAGMQAREELSNDRDYSQKACGRHNTGPNNNFTRGRCDDCLAQAKYGTPSPREVAISKWLQARDLMLKASEELAQIGLHKQLCNRLIEPWMFITVIVSATSFDNWFHLRDHWQAQPEIAWVARDMHAKIQESKPERLEVGDWHLPFISNEDRRDAVKVADNYEGRDRVTVLLKKVSTGRVARVSLLTHDGKRDLSEDVGLHDRLLAGRATNDPLHMSPFEHVAQALDDPNEPSGNFRGWKQYRKEIVGEHHGEVLP